MKQAIARGGLVLYADDDADDRLFMELGFLPHPELRLRTFPDAIALLSSIPGIGAGHISAIIVDKDMPRLGGIETLRKLRSLPAMEHTPLVLFTTSLSTADRIACAALNARCFLKPGGLREQEIVIDKIISTCCQY